MNEELVKKYKQLLEHHRGHRDNLILVLEAGGNIEYSHGDETLEDRIEREDQAILRFERAIADVGQET